MKVKLSRYILPLMIALLLALCGCGNDALPDESPLEPVVSLPEPAIEPAAEATPPHPGFGHRGHAPHPVHGGGQRHLRQLFVVLRAQQ
ncbi:MAG: hypothetical protein Q4B48_01365 [Syntrophomonadaceae bacterium]|nr:hypothetical protein [Syntrophomonadaceae bacterium]